MSIYVFIKLTKLVAENYQGKHSSSMMESQPLGAESCSRLIGYWICDVKPANS
jgi:hypothetical protein